ncbi:MAG: AraC family transcriptional regulator [Alphaproteobacteria bacterium]|nr:AraC family transcriptional regulator [Alphaproteobacteria bacterium]
MLSGNVSKEAGEPVAERESKLSLRDYRGEVRAHSHGHHQFVLPLRGALELEAKGRGGFVDDIRGALVASGDLHAFIGHRAARCAILDVPEGGSDLLNAAAEDRRDPFFALDPALFHLLRFVEARGLSDGGIEGLLLATALESIATGQGKTEPRQLRRAITFMEAQSHKPLTVADIAQAAALSESRLYDLFRTWIGTGPQAHLTTIRIRRARAALSGTDLPIARIAQDCGFSDQTAFTRAFRRLTGTTPAAYRKGRDPATGVSI